MSHRRATALIVVILVLIGLALVAFGTWAVMNGETGAGHGTGLDAGPRWVGDGQRAAATNAFEWAQRAESPPWASARGQSVPPTWRERPDGTMGGWTASS